MKIRRYFYKKHFSKELEKLYGKLKSKIDLSDFFHLYSPYNEKNYGKVIIKIITEYNNKLLEISDIIQNMKDAYNNDEGTNYIWTNK